MKCQRQIWHIHWSQHVTNAEISARTGLPPVMDFIRRRHLSVFGHIARLTQGPPAHNALIRSFTWQGLDTSSWSSSHSLDRPTPQWHWICSCQPLEADRPSYGAMVERRDGPSWLRDDYDDDEKTINKVYYIMCTFCFLSFSIDAYVHGQKIKVVHSC